MVGERVVEIIEGVLSDEISVREALKELERLKSTEKNKITCAIRLVKAYENQSYLDFCGHLRQVIIYYGYPIKIENRKSLIAFSYFLSFTQAKPLLL